MHPAFLNTPTTYWGTSAREKLSTSAIFSLIFRSKKIIVIQIIHSICTDKQI